MTHPVLETRSFQPHLPHDDVSPGGAWAEETDAWDAVASSALIHRVRWHTGLSQAQFADAYGIDPGHLKALEQGMVQPDSALVSYLTVIDWAPEVVRAALKFC